MTSSSTLAALLSDGPMRVTALAARQGVTQPTMTTAGAFASNATAWWCACPIPPTAGPPSSGSPTPGPNWSGTAVGSTRRVVAGYVRMLPDGRRRSLDEALPAIRALETSCAATLPDSRRPLAAVGGTDGLVGAAVLIGMLGNLHREHWHRRGAAASG